MRNGVTDAGAPARAAAGIKKVGQASTQADASQQRTAILMVFLPVCRQGNPVPMRHHEVCLVPRASAPEAMHRQCDREFYGCLRK